MAPCLFGLQVEQVEQLEVVTGTGERVRCSRTRNADLFDAVRGGQGQFGIIAEAWNRLRGTGARIRQYGLRYRDFDRFASDFERMVDEGRFDHLRVETRIHDREILVNAGTEYDGDLDERAVLDGLGHDEIATVRDNADVGRATMFPSWGFIRGNFHPWRDWFLPWEALRTLLAQSWMNEAWVPRAPRSWVGMYPIGTGSVDAPLVMHPKGERMLLYSILAVLGKYKEAWELSRRLEEVDRILVGLGGKGYLSAAWATGAENGRSTTQRSSKRGSGGRGSSIRNGYSQDKACLSVKARWPWTRNAEPESSIDRTHEDATAPHRTAPHRDGCDGSVAGLTKMRRERHRCSVKPH